MEMSSDMMMVARTRSAVCFLLVKLLNNDEEVCV